MKPLLLAVLLIPSSIFGQNLNCDAVTSPLYTTCQIDLTIAIDMSNAMINSSNIDLLVASVYNLTSRYAYGSNTETSVITFGAGGIDSSNFVNDFTTLCQLINSKQIQSHQNGLYSANLATVLNTYKINQPANAREYQRVLILLTAIDDQTQVLNAKPIADSLRVDDNVQIITVTVGKYASDYLYLLGNQSYASLSYYIDASTLDSIGYASCLNSGFIYTTVPYYPTDGSSVSPVPDDNSPTPLPPIIINGTDGALCDTNHTLAWLDLVIVIESTSATALQWGAIVGNILTYLTQMPLSNSANVGHTSRVAIITYDSSPNPVQQYQFSDRQDTKNIQFALNVAKPNTTSSKGNIASGLRAANDYLNSQDSFRVKGVILYAATYDDSSTNNPVEAALELKGDLIKIATVSYDAANGVNTPKIGALASPGLSLTSKDSLVSFAIVISQLNCRCPAGWTQLVVNNAISYADCFYYQFSNSFPGCDGSTILAVANTPARLDFITQLASNWTQIPTSEINIGLVRYDANSPWMWANGQSYTDTSYPPFFQTPTMTDTYGYLTKNNNYNWQLLSDDSLNTRKYVCQRRACDANHLCDLSV